MADFEQKINLKSGRSKDIEAKAHTTVTDSTMKDSIGSLLDSCGKYKRNKFCNFLKTNYVFVN